MGQDEEATLHSLKVSKEIIAESIHHHQGRVVSSPGDNVLAEFVSVINAVQCALDIQEKIKSRNKDLPDSRKMEFRIGVNLGDIIVDGDSIYGDGVNIAARLESLAEPGGICISGSAYDQIENKLKIRSDYLGNQSVKNIVKPVAAYLIWKDSVADAPAVEHKEIDTRKYRLTIAIAIVAALLLSATAGILLHLRKDLSPSSGKPSIAVLPFANLSADASQEYFSDGITNDIITDLSKFPELLVIASNTVFSYKGKSVPVDDIGRDLNVRYVLEGSVQKSGNRLRINTQLIDASTGHHLWAERYERELKDLFDVQEEIIESTVKKLALKIDEIERARAMRKGTRNLEAYDYLLQGRHHHVRFTRSDNIKARELFKKALELDPDYAAAYVALGNTYFTDFDYGWTEFSEESIRRSEALVRKALELDKVNVSAHRLLGEMYYRQLKFDIADAEFQKAMALNPKDVILLKQYGVFMLYSGHSEKAIQLIENSLRFDPYTSPGNLMNLSIAYYLQGRYEDAIRVSERALVKHPDFAGHHIALAVSFAQLGNKEDAAREVKKVQELSPFLPVEGFGSIFLDPKDRAAIQDGLQKAGLK